MTRTIIFARSTIFIEKDFFKSLTQAARGREKPSTFNKSRTYDLLVSPDSLSQSYKKLVGA